MPRAPSTAATRPGRATSSATAARPTCASSASRRRTRSCSPTSARSGCACDARAVHPHGVQRGAAGGELDRAHGRRARRGARLAAELGGGDELRRRPRASPTSARSAAASAGASPERRTRPTSSSTCASRPRCRWRRRGAKALEFAARRSTASRRRSYVTAPGAEIEEGHPLVAALDAAHAEVFGEPPERDVTRWFSDASVLTRYGIATVNYGTSSGLPDAELGENLEIEGLVKTAEVYARVGDRRSAGWRREARHLRRAAASGVLDGEEIAVLDVPSMRDVLRARRRGRDRRAGSARRGPPARADRPEEVLPHGRQLPRARGGVEARRLVARDRARGSSSSRTSTRSSARTSRSSIPST